MAELKPVSDLARLSSRVVRILGQNPGPYTLNGTNTYLVHPPATPAAVGAGRNSVTHAVLIDTGEGIDAYIPLLERALRGQDVPSEEPGHAKLGAGAAGAGLTWISDIILTHRHGDHTKGLPSVLALLGRLRTENTGSNPASSSSSSSTGTSSGDAAAASFFPAPRIHKFRDAETDTALASTLSSLPPGFFTAARDSSPLWPLDDNDCVSLPGAAGGKEDGVTLRVVHTPGHTADHICLLLEEERTLFSADHVLGSGTSVFEDLNAYLGSLEKCISILEGVGPTASSVRSNEAEDGSGKEEADENILYPGHGPIVVRGRGALRTYLSHRLERENQILSLLSSPPPRDSAASVTDDGGGSEGGEGWTISSLVSTLYSSYPEHLFPAAARGLFLHLDALSKPRAGRPPRVRAEGDDYTIKVDAPKTENEFKTIMHVRWKLVEDESSSSGEGRGSTAVGGGGGGGGGGGKKDERL